jgi:cell division protein FtsB
METILILAVVAALAFAYYLWGKGAGEITELRARLDASHGMLERLQKENEYKRKYIRKLEKYLAETANVDGVADMLNRLFHPDGDSGEALPPAGSSNKAPD